MKDIVVVGAGGFGREVCDVIEALAVTSDVRLLGVVDDQPSEINLDRLQQREIRYLGTSGEFIDRLDSSGVADLHYVVGINSPSVKTQISARFEAACVPAAVLVHPQATVGSAVQLGVGTVICAGARVNTNVRIGRHVHVNPNCNVGHDTVLEDFVSVNPLAAISGEVTVGTGVVVGSTAFVFQGISVGENAVIGASSCVVNDVPADATVKGVPAR